MSSPGLTLTSVPLPTISSSLPGPEVAVDLAEDERMEKREQVAKEGQFHGAHIDAFPVALPWQQLRASSTDCWVPSIAWPGMSCWGPPDLNEGSSWAMLTAPQEEALKAQTLCLGLNLQQSVLGTGAAGSRGPDPRVPDSTPACSLVSCTGTVGGGACKVAASELPGTCGPPAGSEVRIQGLPTSGTLRCVAQTWRQHHSMVVLGS